MPKTEPGDISVSTTPLLAIDATYKDARTGALYVHSDLVRVQEPWAEEDHLSPPKASEQFGDVESWAAYIKRFSGIGEFEPLLTWNSNGLRAVLDYHSDTTSAGRLQWTAAHGFERSPEFKAWMALADGRPKGQREAIEALEDRGAEIVDPKPAELMALLRSLRATVNAKADTELSPDGSTSVKYSQEKTVKGGTDSVSLPPELTIVIPVLKGDDKGYKLTVRVRASVDDSAHLTLRFTIPNAERALELVYADRVAAAKDLLGNGFNVLRAAG